MVALKVNHSEMKTAAMTGEKRVAGLEPSMVDLKENKSAAQKVAKRVEKKVKK